MCHGQVRANVRQGVKDIIHRIGVTTIIVTHDQEEAFDIADKVIIFNRCARVFIDSICCFWLLQA